VRFFKFILINLFATTLFAQNESFKYDQEIFAKYAEVAMVEYLKSESDVESVFQNKYDVKNYLTAGRIIENCNGEKTKVVLVAFKNISGEYHASVYMAALEEGFFHYIIDRGLTMVTPESEVESFLTNADGYELFHCGI